MPLAGSFQALNMNTEADPLITASSGYFQATLSSAIKQENKKKQLYSGYHQQAVE